MLGMLLKCELGVDDLIDPKYRAQAFMPISLTSVASRERPRGLEVDISTTLCRHHSREGSTSAPVKPDSASLLCGFQMFSSARYRIGL